MLDNLQNKNSIVILVISIAAIFLSGLFFGVTYLLMDSVQEGFEANDCVISNNAYVDSCQDLWSIALYPILGMKNILVWFSYFFIFALVLGLLVLCYRSGTSPALMGVVLVSTIVVTYIGIEMSNIYRMMLNNPTFFEMMVNFTIYNKIMLNFPWFVAFVGLASMGLGMVNLQRSRVNTSDSDLDY